jgi:nucleoside-diphosphate-sugar epimerase
VKCLVSGATGFIGRHLCQQLAAGGDTVIALSKSGAGLPDGTPSLALDLAAQDVPEDCLSSVDVVFHLAGIAHHNAAPQLYEQLNYRATIRLARQAASAGVGCFIFLSSVRAMGPSRVDTPRSEAQCTTPVDAYGASKWRAECALREQFADDNMSVVILRPALVYGHEPKGNLQLLARGVRCGLPRPPAVGRRSMIALPDLVELLSTLAHAASPGVNTWIACGAHSYSTRELYDCLRRVAGKGAGSAWLPLWGWRLAAALLDLMRTRDGEATYEKLFGTELYTNEALLAATDWRPGSRLEQVMGAGEV